MSLRSVTFASLSPNPTHYGTNPIRTVTWILNDGAGADLNTAKTTVNITATPLVDSPPVVTVSNVTATHRQSFAASTLLAGHNGC
jgi:hypothetical protein